MIINNFRIPDPRFAPPSPLVNHNFSQGVTPMDIRKKALVAGRTLIHQLKASYPL